VIILIGTTGRLCVVFTITKMPGETTLNTPNA